MAEVADKKKSIMNLEVEKSIVANRLLDFSNATLRFLKPNVAFRRIQRYVN